MGDSDDHGRRVSENDAYDDARHKANDLEYALQLPAVPPRPLAPLLLQQQRPQRLMNHYDLPVHAVDAVVAGDEGGVRVVAVVAGDEGVVRVVAVVAGGRVRVRRWGGGG